MRTNSIYVKFPIIFLLVLFSCGNAVAQNQESIFKEGLKYWKGESVEQDYTKAFELFNSIPNYDNAEMQNMMGLMYENGIGAPKNTDEAVKWYLKAAKNGHPEAQVNMFSYLWQVSTCRSYLGKDDKQAIGWLEKAAKQDNASALYFLGLVYQMGYCGKKVNYKKAMSYYIDASKRGSGNAFFNLGLLYTTGTYVQKDFGKANICFTDAISHGSVAGYWGMYLIYTYGTGVFDNKAKAKMYLQKAAEGGYDPAIRKLEEEKYMNSK